ncbi:MAG TPA: hypothetical protein VEJ63_05695 [Planctomycetota bacterium]|nr:hypothetical protein [Planctomycetota bacterium]
MRVASEKKMKNGGWIHKLDGAQPRPTYTPPPAEQVNIDFPKLATGAYMSMADSRREILADKLGLSVEALLNIGVGWLESKRVYTFPMQEWTEEGAKIVGIRTRTESGEKFCVKGSRNALFVPMNRPGAHVLIVEGPTDACAAFMLGIYAIGRPNNVGGEDMLVSWFTRNPSMAHVKAVSVLADRDQGETGERTFDAALSVARRLTRRFEMRVFRLPDCKDLREWVRQGNTTATLQTIIRSRSRVSAAKVWPTDGLQHAAKKEPQAVG